MNDLTPEKLDEVARLLSKTSPQTAARLVAMFERVKVKGVEAIPTSALLDAVRVSGVSLPAQMNRMPGFDRLFFEPFEDLFEAAGPAAGQRPLPGHLPREGLKPVWERLAQEVAPQLHEALDPQVRAAVLRGAMGQAAGLTARFRDAVAEALARPGAAQRWTSVMCADPGSPVTQVAARLPGLLLAESRARPLLAEARSHPKDMPDTLVKAFAETLRTLEATSAQAALELMLLAMSDLAKPWQALRILAAASKGVTDRKLALTEFQVVGERLLAQGQRELDQMAAAAGGQPFGSAALVHTVERFGNLVSGMLREDVLAQDGPWRAGLQKLQSAAAARLEALCQRAEALTDSYLPIDRVRLKGAGLVDRPRTSAELRMDKVDQLPTLYAFLRDVRLFASAAGFSGARDKAVRAIERHLDTVRTGLLAVRDGSPRGTHHDQWTRVTLTLMAAFESEDAARTFERRLAA
jgi:hypothetical protein